MERFLEICIDSVLAQTYKNLEIILIDDGSTDNSGYIADRYAQQDSRIRVLHKCNGGLAAARQSGFELATGEYVLCLDSDDCIHPETIWTLYDVAIAMNSPVTQCDLQVIDEVDRSYNHEVHDKGIHKFSPYDAYRVVEENDEGLGHNARLSTTVTWGKLIRRDVLEKVIPIKPVRIHEDQVLITRLLSVIDFMVYVEKDYYYYRNRTGSIIRNGWNSAKLVILDIYRERLATINALHNVSSQEREKLEVLVYKRYMISMIRNAILVRQNVRGNEKKILVKSIIKRFRDERKKEYEKKLSRKERVFFGATSRFPRTFFRIYETIKRDI